MKTTFTHKKNRIRLYARAKSAWILVVFILFAFTASAATKTWTGAVSTDWNTAGNWSPSGVPVSGDNVFIPGSLSRYPVISTTQAISDITINSAGSGASLTVSSGAILTASGLITVNANGSLVQTGGTSDLSGITTNGTVTISGGTITCDVNLIINSGSTFNQSGGTIHMAASTGSNPSDHLLINSGGVYNQSGGTFYIKDWNEGAGTFNQTGSSAIFKIYRDWKPGTGSVFNSTSGTVQFTGSSGAGADFASGTRQFNNLIIDAGVDPGFSNTSSSSISISGNYTNINTSLNESTNSTFTFNGAGSQTITSASTGTNVTFGNLVINKASGTVSLASNVVIIGNTSVTSGIFNLSTYTANRKSSGGTLTVSNGATMQLGAASGGQTGSNFPTNYSTVTLSTGSTVEYNGSNAISQTVYAIPAYSNLSLTNGTGSGSATKTTSANITVNGNLTINSGAVLSPSAASLIGGSGTLTGSGTAQVTRTTITADFLSQYTITNKTLTNLTVDYNSTASQTINGLNYKNLTISGSRGINLVTFDAVNPIGVSGSFTTSATFSTGSYVTTGSTVNLNGNTDQTVPGLTFNNIILSGAGTTKTFSSTMNLLSTITVNSNVTVDMGTNVLASGLTIINNGNIKTQSTAANPFPVGLTWNGVVEYNNPTGGQTIANGTYANLKVNNASGTSTANGNITVSSALDLTSGTLALGANSLTISSAINRTSGVIDASNGTVVFNGSSSQSIPANTFSGSIKNLTINNSSNVINNANRTISNALTLTAGSLDLNGTTLTLGGTVSGSGKIKGSTTSSLVVNSSAGSVGTINLDQSADGTSNALSNFTNAAGTTTLGNKLQLFTKLDITGGTLNLDGKNLVLKSNATNTAIVGNLTGTITGATNVTVERFIPNNGRRYRMITPGVNTTGSIKDNWMEGGMNTIVGTNVNPNPGYGTQITGPGGNANGFDVSQTNNASLYTYNPTTQTWVAVTNTNQTLNANTGYLIFIRGDRSVDMTAPGSNPLTLASTGTTLRSTGTLVLGDQTSGTLQGSGANNLIGNPFASSVEWSSIHGNNSSKFENYYTYWDPTVGARGAFVTVNTSGQKSNGAVNATTDIQSGQAFFIKSKSSAVSPTFQVKENNKSANNNKSVFRTASQMQQLYASLYFTDNQKRYNADGVLAAFDATYSKEVTEDDAQQIASWDEDLAILTDNKKLSIETRPLINANDTIHLSVARLKIQGYELQFDPSNFGAAGKEIYLVDRFTNLQSPISSTNTTIVPFTVTSDVASSASNRFYIVFRTISALPIKLVEFSGKKSNDNNELKWVSASEENFGRFELEYSTDQNQYSKLATIDSKGSAAAMTSYAYVHKNVTSNTNYYRLKMIDRDGSSRFSNVVFIKKGDIQINVNHVYPNPFADELNIDINSQIQTQAFLYLYDMQGKTIRKLPINITPGSNSISLQNLQALGSGTYVLSVKGEALDFSTQVVKGIK